MQTHRTGRLARIRRAPLHERASVALGGMFGAEVREIVYCLAEGDALTGGQLWADRYDGRLDDIFAVQDKLVRVIVDALALKLSKDEEREIAPYLLISAGSA